MSDHSTMRGTPAVPPVEETQPTPVPPSVKKKPKQEQPQGPKVYDLTEQEEIIPIRGKDGIIRNHVMREMLGDEKDEFLTEQARRMRFDRQGNPIGMKDVRGITAKLLSMSIFTMQGDPVPAEEIEKWPASMQNELAKKAMLMNGLTELSKEEKEAALERAKNA